MKCHNNWFIIIVVHSLSQSVINNKSIESPSMCFLKRYWNFRVNTATKQMKRLKRTLGVVMCSIWNLFRFSVRRKIASATKFGLHDQMTHFRFRGYYCFCKGILIKSVHSKYWKFYFNINKITIKELNKLLKHLKYYFYAKICCIFYHICLLNVVINWCYINEVN